MSSILGNDILLDAMCRNSIKTFFYATLNIVFKCIESSDG